ncbi:spermidine/putrescine ABC transporter substrate-binding protein [Candidatus Methylacidiphilum fumarolicum]|uniref:Spermidine/putrescine-binding periplasmic protein n=2 Tax=Candidatus Methylacidiphilum fumarolicum TaxID=591154 RepID=I0JYT6_METFB|nr:ABC transporter substrate-binding protein [Candidatus Methylacidiphilum fumarolicum]MBW6415040.1 ABC transporter substrate-binding protein [Candidatus Methylacidiphilum fumarolicum]TFE69726.1 spermidine/putrescine ABC transporter substrate-binding protein [Candidatus Methylacidiphilum fumarolicum]TFE74883.1 spermidine/putrescine ABC transporter substrate-binding protein [Candidatus Methylacidiphilum fumarolicum]TFE75528.1 spermidine/putrescine ABC transporter substrate-binding protein [Candi
MNLQLLVPEGHLLESSLLDYQKAFGNQLSPSFYTDETSAFEEIQKEKFDLVAIPDRLVYTLQKQNLLAPLPIDQKLLPRVDHKFLYHYYDQSNHYCWPYGWTLLGIGFPKATGSKVYPTHWSELHNPLYTIDYPQDSFLKGLIIQSIDKTSLGKTSNLGQKLVAQNNPTPPLHIRIDTISELLKTNEKEKKWTVYLPKEYSWITIFHWAIPRSAANMDRIKESLLFLCSPQEQAAIVSTNWLGAVSPDTYTMTPEYQRQSSLLYPPETYLNQCRFFRMDIMSIEIE